MTHENVHPPDQELLQFVDGELPAPWAAELRAHFAACWECRARVAEIEAIMGEFSRAYQDTADFRLPPIARPRAQLKAHLEKLSQGATRASWRWPYFAFNAQVLALAGALVFFAAFGAIVLHLQTLNHGTAAYASAGMLPDPTLTPGATTGVAMADICSINRDDVVRAVPSGLQQTVLAEYRIPHEPAANYEIDFLISPGLGGAENVRNLWPEPRYNTAWNSFVKDQLEAYLHQSVCSGTLSLVAAQQDMAGNWISAYKKYFHTDRPLADVPERKASKASGPILGNLLLGADTASMPGIDQDNSATATHKVAYRYGYFAFLSGSSSRARVNGHLAATGIQEEPLSDLSPETSHETRLLRRLM